MILANFKISPDSPRESSFDKPELNLFSATLPTEMSFQSIQSEHLQSKISNAFKNLEKFSMEMGEIEIEEAPAEMEQSNFHKFSQIYKSNSQQNNQDFNRTNNFKHITQSKSINRVNTKLLKPRTSININMHSNSSKPRRVGTPSTIRDNHRVHTYTSNTSDNEINLNKSLNNDPAMQQKVSLRLMRGLRQLNTSSQQSSRGQSQDKENDQNILNIKKTFSCQNSQSSKGNAISIRTSTKFYEQTEVVKTNVNSISTRSNSLVKQNCKGLTNGFSKNASNNSVKQVKQSVNMNNVTIEKIDPSTLNVDTEPTPFLEKLPIIVSGTLIRRLSWSDFQAEPDYTQKWSAFAFWNISYKYQADQKMDNEFGSYYKMSLNVDCDFQRHKSWNKCQHQHLLNHENGHLIIGCLCALEFKMRAQAKKYTTDYIKEVQHIFKLVLAKWLEIEKRYDGETEHRANLVKQREWNDFLLKKLEYFQKIFNKKLPPLPK